MLHAPVPTTRWGGMVDLQARARHNMSSLLLGRSRIDGTGLFASRDIHMDDVICEYSGELVDDAVCEAREAYYEARGIADYMFRLGPDEIVDATLRGCRARYVNHSCDPNCFAVITLPEEGMQAGAGVTAGEGSEAAGAGAGIGKAGAGGATGAGDEDCSGGPQDAPWRPPSGGSGRRAGGGGSGIHARQATVVASLRAIASVPAAGSRRLSARIASSAEGGTGGHAAGPQAAEGGTGGEDGGGSGEYDDEAAAGGPVAAGLTPPGAAKPRWTHSGRRVFVYALRHIHKGEELTYDYQFPAEERTVHCRCGAAACRGSLNMVDPARRAAATAAANARVAERLAASSVATGTGTAPAPAV
jgi:hypothetical protein